jgi:hypothetical protein
MFSHNRLVPAVMVMLLLGIGSGVHAALVTPTTSTPTIVTSGPYTIG